MAPLSFTLPTAATSYSPFFSQNQRAQHAKQTRRFQVSCNVSSEDQEKPLPTNTQPQKLILPQTSLDRRNLLLGLGGIYSTVNMPSAFATPIASPGFDLPSLKPSCRDATSGFNDTTKDLLRSKKCCPPASKKGPERRYKIEEITGPTRTRKPIHNSPECVKKYMDALKIMRGLPDDDPRSFTNQAKIHCAYCNGSYMQNGQELQIHNSWLFFPFHRWYLFFYERILGDLIKDPHFALPYWNWDNPNGGMCWFFTNLSNN
ncbi:hypothetical protein LXL04_017700 [Taraxacum kok-saghyz]